MLVGIPLPTHIHTPHAHTNTPRACSAGLFACPYCGAFEGRSFEALQAHIAARGCDRGGEGGAHGRGRAAPPRVPDQPPFLLPWPAGRALALLPQR